MSLWTSTKKRKRKEKKKKREMKIYSYKTRVKAVKLYMEEGFSKKLIAEELGMSDRTVDNWVRTYKKLGEEGLKPKRRGKSTTNKIPEPVKEKIIEIKKDNPEHGSKKISQFLRRIFFLKASPETVRRTLQEENLVEKPKRKRVKNPQKPRFFERATPNQLWQSDIMSFRLGGQVAYIIGYMDDYSRYITGLGLFRSQTAEHVIEVYRTGIAEYHPPKEMLTDNGRQYTNWRGKTRFEKELKKDKVKHLKSRKAHPMTLGKIERFWQTIFEEFLSRAQFTSFEEARERIARWIKYYNHRRPHQGIKGLCPADRYFEVSNELKNIIDSGIEENILEMALRGKPKDPFYMVGRMDGQSVMIMAEKGKIKMSVDGDENDKTKEYEYDINGVKDGEEKTGKKEENEDIQCNGEVPGSVIGMVGDEETGRHLQGYGCKLDNGGELAGGSINRNAEGTGHETEKGEGTCIKSEIESVIGKKEPEKESKSGYRKCNGREYRKCVECETGNNKTIKKEIIIGRYGIDKRT